MRGDDAQLVQPRAAALRDPNAAREQEQVLRPLPKGDSLAAVRVSRQRVDAAQAAVDQARDALRRAAAEAVLAGTRKTDTANAAKVSRPTLDAWIADHDEPHDPDPDSDVVSS